MLVVFQVATQKFRKSLNSSMNRTTKYFLQKFKFYFWTKPQIKFWLKQKLKISKFWTTFVFKSFPFEAMKKEKRWVYELGFGTSNYLQECHYSISSPARCSTHRRSRRRFLTSVSTCRPSRPDLFRASSCLSPSGAVFVFSSPSSSSSCSRRRHFQVTAAGWS